MRGGDVFKRICVCTELAGFPEQMDRRLRPTILEQLTDYSEEVGTGL